jgi:hypothetical protein
VPAAASAPLLHGHEYVATLLKPTAAAAAAAAAAAVLMNVFL